MTTTISRNLNGVENIKRPLSGMNDDEVLDWWNVNSLGLVRPEMCEEVAPVYISPPEGEVPFILDQAQVRPEWADSSLLQCNVCGSRSKFKLGGFYAYYRDGYIYVIGPVCGSEDHQASVQKARNNYEKRIYREIADDRVLDFLDNTNLWEQRLKRVEEYDRVCVQLRSCLSHDFIDFRNVNLFSDIERVMKTDGGTLKHHSDRTGYDTNIHRLSCIDVFRSNSNTSELTTTLGEIAKNFGFSFRAQKKKLEYDESNVEILSKLISKLDEALNKKERHIVRAQKNIVDDVKGILRWQEKKETSMSFGDARISASFLINDYQGKLYERESYICDFKTLVSEHRVIKI